MMHFAESQHDVTPTVGTSPLGARTLEHVIGGAPSSASSTFSSGNSPVTVAGTILPMTLGGSAPPQSTTATQQQLRPSFEDGVRRAVRHARQGSDVSSQGDDGLVSRRVRSTIVGMGTLAQSSSGRPFAVAMDEEDHDSDALNAEGEESSSIVERRIGDLSFVNVSVPAQFWRKRLAVVAAFLLLLSLPAMYLVPIVGLLMMPASAIVTYWLFDDTRFAHGGDIRRCVNRDCSLAFFLMVAFVTLCVTSFNVVAISLEVKPVASSDASLVQPAAGSGSNAPPKAARVVGDDMMDTARQDGGQMPLSAASATTSAAPATSNHVHGVATGLERKEEIVLNALIAPTCVLSMVFSYRLKQALQPISAASSAGDEAGMFIRRDY